MARPRGNQKEQDIRRHLLEESTALRDRYGWLDPAAFAELSKPVDQLSAGAAWSLRRYELPDDHPARTAGAAGDLLTLDESDVLYLHGH
ncbi:hypothetical protein [Nocardia acidivorans]|uniref:hypothetical protein n=1 Tax=Nocardia acidivorans TaxID=404580 RepID=UPI00082B5E63|nr:hypothetical protein [Nocardia acidivorans]